MNISVITPVYNAADFLEKAVNSALELQEVKEIILVEDCSTDNSLEVCKKLVNQFPDKVKLYQHPDQGNHGAGATRNLGLEKASQEYIAFLDADDYYLPNRFDAEKEIFKDSKIEGVFNAIGTDFLTEKGKTEFKEKFKNAQLTTVKKHAEGSGVFYGLMGIDKDFGVFFTLDALTIKKSVIERSGLRFNEKLRVHQDTDFIVKLSHHAYLKSGNITEAVAMRGVHDENRITKIKLYSQKYYQNFSKVYKSRFEWIKSQNLPKSVKDLVKLRYLTFRIAKENGAKKLALYAYYLIANPKLLKTEFRFHILKTHEND